MIPLSGRRRAKPRYVDTHEEVEPGEVCEPDTIVARIVATCAWVGPPIVSRRREERDASARHVSDVAGRERLAPCC